MAKSKIIKIAPNETIIRKIYLLRSEKVMLDSDLAELYGVETNYLKRQVRRNIERFPEDFMFELNTKELQSLRCQFGTSSWGGSRYSPFVFTEQGVSMLSGVINSPKAIEMNITIMRAFVEMRKLAHSSKKIAEQIKKLIDRVGEHDTKLAGIYDAIENLLDKNVEEKNCEEKERIGFKAK
ncbi:MAG: ORF6N domain-containing protein [Bacteroidota bacterium]|nr:ORF6N domain-containing protein [Bacteroidota bacterium]